MANENKQISDEVVNAVLKKVVVSLKRGITDDYMDELKDRIVKRTQLGIGIDPETNASKKLAPLSDAYKARRKGSSINVKNKFDRKRARKAKKENKIKPKLVSTTTPSKSNLTATGQLLKALTVVKLKVKNAWGYRITISDRRGKDLFGRSSKIGNKELVGYLASGKTGKPKTPKPRVFLGWTKSQRNKISKEIRDIIIKFIK